MSDGAVLAGKRIAMLVEEGFEDRELTGPLETLRAAGATVTIIGPTAGTAFKGKRGDAVVTADLAAGAAKTNDFDALVIPGGHAPDKMRMRHAMVDFAREMMEANKPVAAICHAPWVLIDAGVIRGRKLTSWEHIQTDVKNAGGNWVNEEVVVDNGLVTSRKPDDIPAFNKKMIEEFAEGKHAKQTQMAGAELET